MKLFISHASEDKSDFVRPLAEALKPFFEIWYDEYELTLGDSLFKNINAGLTTCDYGVVVLSPSFFRKKWPQAELDGLFALESTNRKVILPIWKDIDETGVRGYSPILAGRVAAPASDGIVRVVAAIKFAIDASERAKGFPQSAGLALRLKKVAVSHKTKQEADMLLATRAGADLIAAEFQKLGQAIETQVNSFGQDADPLKFTFQKDWSGIEVHAPFRLRLRIQLDGMAVNGGTLARLKCLHYQLRKSVSFGSREEPRKLQERSFRPYFGEASEVVWTSPNNSTDDSMTTEQVVVALSEQLIGYIEKEAEADRST